MWWKKTRYRKLWQSEDTDRVEKALRRYKTDKELLDADSVNFKPIDDIDIGEKYLVSYHMPLILPISEILWIRFKTLFGKLHMETLLSDGYA